MKSLTEIINEQIEEWIENEFVLQEEEKKEIIQKTDFLRNYLKSKTKQELDYLYQLVEHFENIIKEYNDKIVKQIEKNKQFIDFLNKYVNEKLEQILKKNEDFYNFFKLNPDRSILEIVDLNFLDFMNFCIQKALKKVSAYPNYLYLKNQVEKINYFLNQEKEKSREIEEKLQSLRFLIEEVKKEK